MRCPRPEGVKKRYEVVLENRTSTGEIEDMIKNNRSDDDGVNAGPRNTIHVRCGSDILEGLMQAGLPGAAIEWSDPVSQGPLPTTNDPVEFASERARFLATDYRLNEEKVRESLIASDRALDTAIQDAEEIVLWFEHDLYDQAVLVNLLSRIGDRSLDHLRMVTLHEHPSVDRFLGLGQLEPEHFPALYASREPVERAAVDIAMAVWFAMRQNDPSDLAALTEMEMPGLPYLRAALNRFLADYPGIDDGLAETERLILKTVAGGAHTPGRVFGDLQKAEEAPWLGDLMLWPWIIRLATANRPAIAFEEPIPTGPFDRTFTRQRLSLTDFGRALLSGTAHWLEVNRVDRWIGGAAPTDVINWRWDPNACRIVSLQ